MTDVFISYARKDEAIAERLAEALEKLGWSAWWDRRIRTGGRFDRVIEEAIKNAKAVIVMWSEHAVESDWVRGEAYFAVEHRKNFMPVRIDPVILPRRFLTIHTVDITSWAEGTEPTLPERFIDDLRDRLSTAETGSNRRSI
jgi:hypothetical protein